MKGELIVPKRKGLSEGEKEASSHGPEVDTVIQQSTKTSEELLNEYRLEYDRPAVEASVHGDGKGRVYDDADGSESFTERVFTKAGDIRKVLPPPTFVRRSRVEKNAIQVDDRPEQEGTSGKTTSKVEQNSPIRVVGDKINLGVKKFHGASEEQSLMSDGSVVDGSLAFTKKQEIWERFAKRDLSAPMKAAYAVLYPALYGQDKPDNTELLQYMHMRKNQEEEFSRGSVKIMKSRPKDAIMPKMLLANELLLADDTEDSERTSGRHSAATVIQYVFYHQLRRHYART